MCNYRSEVPEWSGTIETGHHMKHSTCKFDNCMSMSVQVLALYPNHPPTIRTDKYLDKQTWELNMRSYSFFLLGLFVAVSVGRQGSQKNRNWDCLEDAKGRTKRACLGEGMEHGQVVVGWQLTCVRIHTWARVLQDRQPTQGLQTKQEEPACLLQLKQPLPTEVPKAVWWRYLLLWVGLSALQPMCQCWGEGVPGGFCK